MIVAGKLYADPEVIRPWSLAQAGKSVSTLIYAQTRGDLQRLYTVCLLTGHGLLRVGHPAGVPGADVERGVQAGGDDARCSRRGGG